MKVLASSYKLGLRIKRWVMKDPWESSIIVNILPVTLNKFNLTRSNAFSVNKFLSVPF